MTYIIDRIEEGIATLECQSTGEILHLPEKDLPKYAKEGHILQINGNSFIIDKARTEKRRDEMRQRLDNILKKSQ